MTGFIHSGNRYNPPQIVMGYDWTTTSPWKDDKSTSRDWPTPWQGMVKVSPRTWYPKIALYSSNMKDVLRLHPPAPFFVPDHRAEMSAELCGYYVSKNAQIWVNVQSMGCDSTSKSVAKSKFICTRKVFGERNWHQRERFRAYTLWNRKKDVHLLAIRL